MKKILIGLFLGFTLSAYSQVDSILNVVDNKYERYTHYMESGNRRLAENELNMLIKSLYNIVAMMYDDQTSGGSNQEQFKSRIDVIYDAIFPFPIFSYDADVNYDSINIEIDTIALDSVYSESSNSGGLVHLGSSGRLDVTGDYYIDGGNLYLNNEIFFDELGAYSMLTTPFPGADLEIRYADEAILDMDGSGVVIRSISGGGLLAFKSDLEVQNIVSYFRDDVHIDSNLYMEDTLYFGDGTYQTTAATGGGGSSSGSAGEIQYSDGSGGFDSDDNFKWSDDTLFFNTQSGNEAYIGWLEGSTDKFYFHLPIITQFELSADGFGATQNTRPFVNYRVDYTEDLTYSWSGTNRNNSGLSLPFANGVLLRGNDAKFYLSGDADTATIQLNGDNVMTWREDTVEINGDLKVTGYIEADSIVLINTTYSDIAFEDDYELMTIKDAVEYAYKNGNLKGMDRDGLTNPISYLNNLELKIEDLYLYTYSQQLEIERLRNLLVVMLIIISLSVVIALYKKI